jgi:uncharacterized protein YndB with AHSA1/START domain
MSMAANAGELVLHLERVLPAPRPYVFRMHSEPELLARWWGPKGFSAPSVELDVRAGGSYRIEMPSLRDLGTSTGLTVEQGAFATEDRRALHERGWTDALDRLEELIASSPRPRS